MDAIIIGSGVGGLGLAVLLAKVGKKVLVLEQHSKAGGCCHTFSEKGFEFDVGESFLWERFLRTQKLQSGLTAVLLLNHRDPLHRGTLGAPAFPLHVGPDDQWTAAVGASGESV